MLMTSLSSSIETWDLVLPIVIIMLTDTANIIPLLLVHMSTRMIRSKDFLVTGSGESIVMMCLLFFLINQNSILLLPGVKSLSLSMIVMLTLSIVMFTGFMFSLIEHRPMTWFLNSTKLTEHLSMTTFICFVEMLVFCFKSIVLAARFLVAIGLGQLLLHTLLEGPSLFMAFLSIGVTVWEVVVISIQSIIFLVLLNHFNLIESMK
uniref:ATP synthase F0 subunit 6 n=1 Tax=Bryozoa sp. TaxID=2813608 RepID=A0AAU8L3U0_9BILA